MSSKSEPAVWKLRLMGAAAGAVSSGLLGLLLYSTVIGLHVGIVGIPSGAITGAIFAPRLLRARAPAGGIVKAAGVGSLLGVASQLAPMAIAMVLAAPSTDGMFPYGVVLALTIAVVGTIFGFPMALVAAALATWWGRRSVRYAERLWIPAAVVLVMMVTLTGVYFVRPAVPGA